MIGASETGGVAGDAPGVWWVFGCRCRKCKYVTQGETLLKHKLVWWLLGERFRSWACVVVRLDNWAMCGRGLVCFLCLAVSVGCTPPAEFGDNSLEWYKQERAARLDPGQGFPEVHRQDVSDITRVWFGTPDAPQLPLLEGEDDPALELLDMGKLAWAAGPVVSRNEESSQGLYRRHCAHCHGVTGDGRGPTSAFLSPYPRDFRLGKFKFKSSPTGNPPTKEDLKTILVNGIPGTSMPSFRLLQDEELDVLVDYVIYLSQRGLVERFLIAAVRELDEDARLVSLPDGVRLRDLPLDVQLGPLQRVAPATLGGESGADVATAVDVESVNDSDVGSDGDSNAEEGEADRSESGDAGGGNGAQADVSYDRDKISDDLLFLAEDQMLPVLEKWLGILDFEAKEVDVPAWVLDPRDAAYASQVALGQKLYFGAANCVQCHGETGIGDGQTNNYDDWTNDWLKVEGINPTDVAAWAPYVNAGAHPPRPIMPRNLRLGVYRGGNRPIDIFRRIQYGIEGTPMPASLTLTEEQIWALVAYVQQLPYETLSRPETAKKLENERPVR